MIICILISIFAVATIFFIYLYFSVDSLTGIGTLRRRRKIFQTSGKVSDFLMMHLNVLFQKMERPLESSRYYKKIESDSKKFGFNYTSRQIVMYKVIAPLFLATIGILIYKILEFIDFVPTVILGIMISAALSIFFKLDNDIRVYKERYYFELSLEMPRFVRTIRYSPIGKPFIQIVKDYIKISKPCIKRDLKVLCTDLEVSHSTEDALLRFAGRIGTPEVKELISILICAERGDRSIAYVSLIFIENRLIEGSKRVIRKKLSNRPEKIEIVNDLLLYSLGLLFLVPMGIVMFRSMGIMLH